MKKSKNIIATAAGTLLLAGLQSCASDAPFDGDGEGKLQLKMVVRSEVTRAIENEADLADKCVIYISDSEGLLYKYQGLNNLPQGGIPMKCGNYVAEAWTGDSVSASFDKKFFSGYQPFRIQKGDNSVTLNCNIANVVASIDASTIDDNLLRDYTITIGNSKASLDFTQENVATAKGYYMMPNGDNNLLWTISGKDPQGKDFIKEGTIENVERAHEYVLNFKFGAADPDEIGGAFIRIEIDDYELLQEQNITVHEAPKVNGMDFDINTPISGEPNTFQEVSLSTLTYGHVKSCHVAFDPYSAFGLSKGGADLADLTSAAKSDLNRLGLTWTEGPNGNGFGEFADDHTTGFITFSADMLNKLPLGTYTVTVTLTDEYERTTVKPMQIIVSNDAVVPIDPTLDDPGAISSYSATFAAKIMKDDAVNPGIEYREKGASEWTKAYPSRSRAVGTVIKVKVNNLKPGATYEYRAIADGFTSSTIQELTTESVFTIPNSSFEEWGTYDSNIIFPGAGSERTFWDTGNKGASLASAILTNKSTDMVHSGTYSARLESLKAEVFGIGKMAAGNIFAGTYDKTVGTNGELTFGRPFDGSHPIKLRGWGNYRPGTIIEKGDYKGNEIVNNMDQGQIFVALATAPSSIKTKNQSQLFNPDGDNILAYGELTWKENFGPDGQLQQFEITLNYKDRSTKPSYIIIVASASKFGDYFCGGNSIMYLDDIELVYE